MVGRTPLFSIHSTIADEHGAQHACNSTSLTPSGTIIAGFFITPMHFGGEITSRNTPFRYTATSGGTSPDSDP